MIEPVTKIDQRRLAAERIYTALIEGQRAAGDAALCDALNMLAGDSGQNKFRSAGTIIGGKRLGRQAIDDKTSLRRVAAFPPSQRREAVGIVAREVAKATGKKVGSIARRLRRKLTKNETDKMVLSAPSIP